MSLKAPLRLSIAIIACLSASLLGSCGGGSSSAGGAQGGSTSSSSTVSVSSSSSSLSSSSSSSSAPPGSQKAGYTLVFDEEFDSLDVSSHGPGTRWIAHTPWYGDFGDAKFADPAPGFPFTVSNGVLRIEARKSADGTWQSGLLASVDPNGVGFSQTYGYFEVRAKLPPGEGVWPAFWLDSLIPATSTDPSLEVDVFEYYGADNDRINSTVTVWPKDHNLSTSDHRVTMVAPGSLTSDFHTYGVSVEPDYTIMYLDGAEIWRTPTPTSHSHPLMILIDLALGGGGRSIQNTPSPSYMYVDYVRAYQKATA